MFAVKLQAGSLQLYWKQSPQIYFVFYNKFKGTKSWNAPKIKFQDIWSLYICWQLYTVVQKLKTFISTRYFSKFLEKITIFLSFICIDFSLLLKCIMKYRLKFLILFFLITKLFHLKSQHFFCGCFWGRPFFHLHFFLVPWSFHQSQYLMNGVQLPKLICKM